VTGKVVGGCIPASGHRQPLEDHMWVESEFLPSGGQRRMQFTHPHTEAGTTGRRCREGPRPGASGPVSGVLLHLSVPFPRRGGDFGAPGT
jgi:hypothetical protein